MPRLITPHIGTLVGLAVGGGYFALVEGARKPETKAAPYLMPDSTDWLALLASGILLWEGYKLNSGLVTGVGSSIGAVHVGKLFKKAQIRGQLPA